MAVDFTQAYTSHWRLVSVDPDTWDDGNDVEGVYSASVNRDATDATPLLETASFAVDQDITDEFEEGWYRLLLIAEQNHILERYPISTVLVEKADDSVNFERLSTNLSGYSVLKPLADRKNIGTDYRYAPKGVNGAQWVAELIDDVTPAPVMVDGDGFKLDKQVVFSPGMTYLQMIWDVLDMKKWCMSIDGEGNITVQARPEEPSMEISYLNPKGLQNGVTRSLDISAVPNRYYAIDNDGNREIAENRNSGSTSYSSRGRWVDYVDTSPTRVDGETLYAYARRRLEEESTVVRQYSYTREYWPEVLPFDLVSAFLPDLGLNEEIRVMSQSLTCGGNGISVSETSGLEIKEWKR